MRYTIIAEAGISHNGDMNYAKKSIEIAKEIGCNIWKTQLYHPESLFPDHKVIVNGHNWYPEVCKTELLFEQALMLKKHCDKIGIEFMASAFDETRLQWLEMLHAHRHKIASKMNQNSDYIKKVLSTEKDVLLSCNIDYNYPLSMTTIDAKLSQHPGCVKQQVLFLYCVPEYPTQLSNLKFPNYEENTSTPFDDWHGFSDHTIGIEASVYAMANGASIIEKHFKLSESDIGPDMIISATPDEMKQLVKFARKFEEINR